jgi:hypothetical protein
MARIHVVVRRRRCGGRGRHVRRFARQAPPLRSLPVDRQTPRHAHQPRAKALAIAQLTEAPIRPREGLLRHVLGILVLTEHRVRHADGECRRFGEAHLELAFARRLLVYEDAGQPIHMSIHRRITARHRSQTPPARRRFTERGVQ